MPASADLLARVDDPRKLKGAQTPYHRFDFNLYTTLSPDSPAHQAGKFLGRLLNPEHKIDIEGVHIDIDTIRRRDAFYFALHGKLPTITRGIILWQNRAVDLGSLFNRSTTHDPGLLSQSSSFSLERALQIDPLQLHPYISAVDAEAGLISPQTNPTILRGVHAQPFLYKEGHSLKGEDPTRAIVTIRTQPAAMYLDERIKEIEHANEERLQRLLMEKDAADRKLAGHQFNSAERLHHLQEVRARIANTTP